MLWRPAHHRRIVQIADGLTTLLSFVVAYYFWEFLRLSVPTLQIGAAFKIDGTSVILMGLAAVLWVVLFNYYGAYSYQRFTSFATEIKIIFKTVALGTLSLVLLLFLLRPGYIPRSMMGLFVLVNLLFLTLEKMLQFFIAQLMRRRGLDRKTVLIVGTGDQTHRFMEAIEENFNWGLDIVGFLDINRERVGQLLFGKPILGSFEDITTVLHSHALDEVIITVSTRRMGEVREVLETCEREGVQVRIISDFLGRIAKRFRAEMIYGLPIISISYIPGHHAALAIKRVMDIAISLSALIFLAPFFLIIAAAIKISSPGPVFYEWNVIGFNKKPFKSWKFRTMVIGADSMKAQLAHLNEMSGPVFKIANDPRIIPVGRFLRKYSLDELPQIWSVLKGDMSLVGPRPAGPHELRSYESWQRRKLSIKPGITCLWQASGRNKINNFEDWAKMDLEYIDNWSLWLDLRILGRTLLMVIKGTGC